jgi:hypothetical protein
MLASPLVQDGTTTIMMIPKVNFHKEEGMHDIVFGSGRSKTIIINHIWQGITS